MNTGLKCLLLAPNFFYAKGSIYKEVSKYDPPLGLAHLSSFLNLHGYNTIVYDLNVEINSSTGIAAFLENLKNTFDYKDLNIGIPFFTTFANNSYHLAQVCRKIFPDATIIAGGAHATFMPDEVLNNENIDIVVRGEGELSLLDIVSLKPLSRIEGISYKEYDSGQIHIKHNKDRSRIKDLDTLPMPAYHQLHLEKYMPVLGSYKSLPAVTMVSSRGCPGRCKFCCRTMGNFVAYRSPQKIIEEIKYLIDNYGIKQVNFYDDTFTLHKNRVTDLCDLIISQGLRFDWTCFSRIDSVDEDLLKKMKAAGCYQIMYGVENFDNTVLDELSKKVNISQIEKIVRLTKRLKINCRVSLLIGSPGDTKQTYRTNLRALKKLKPDIVVINITTPFPGTELYEWAKNNDRLLTNDWNQYDGKQAVMKIDGLTSKEIYKYYHKMYLQFYFRPAYIISRVKTIKSFTEIKVLFIGVYKLLSFLLKRYLARE
ncbi:MAG TPA: radical SAM protein [Bacteroidales bacterium]|nr:radical SAM protein [Bacteroidales bacterium]